MFWADRTTKIGGVALLLLVATVIVDAVLESVVAGDANQLARGDIEGLLRDINDNEAVFYIGNAFAIVADGVATLLVAALLYLLFRERSRTLALFSFVGLLAASLCFLASDMASITTGVLAADFVEKGGPGSIPAGDDITLQSARAVAAVWAMGDFFGLTMLALGLASLGTLFAFAPQRDLNPPRWLGGLVIVSALLLLLIWLAPVEEDVGYAVGLLGILGSLVSIVILGVWLLMHPERERPEDSPAAAQPNPTSM